MNHHAPITTDPATVEAQRFRSLALQLRSNGHEHRRWAREEAAKGHDTAAAGMLSRARQYAADALWYWRRARAVAVQFNTEDAA